MELQKRKRLRLPEYDYSAAGYYFVTICSMEKRCLFGSVGAGLARPIPAVELSPLGKIVQEELSNVPTHYSHVRLDAFVVMPNHVHGIFAFEPAGRTSPAPTLGTVIGGFKAGVSRRAGKAVWQRGFYDHVIRDEADYLRIWAYIDANPAKWAEDRYFVEEH